MTHTISYFYNTTFSERITNAIKQLRLGAGVLLFDDEDREDECDLIFPAVHICTEQMALMIRECSGIVCLGLPEKHCRALNLPPMIDKNLSRHHTAFTISIEAKEGVTTGVSAADRVTTIKAAVADHAKPSDLLSPGHVFPLMSVEGGVLKRRGHTEGSIDLMKLAGLPLSSVLCEVMNVDGTTAKLPDLISFSERYHFPILKIDDIVQYILLHNQCSA